MREKNSDSVTHSQLCISKKHALNTIRAFRVWAKNMSRGRGGQDIRTTYRKNKTPDLYSNFFTTIFWTILYNLYFGIEFSYFLIIFIPTNVLFPSQQDKSFQDEVIGFISCIIGQVLRYCYGLLHLLALKNGQLYLLLEVTSR